MLHLDTQLLQCAFTSKLAIVIGPLRCTVTIQDATSNDMEEGLFSSGTNPLEYAS